MRVETDWVEHCKRWEDPAAGRDNCFTNTDNLDRVFAIEGVPKELPVYVAVARHFRAAAGVLCGSCGDE